MLEHKISLMSVEEATKRSLALSKVYQEHNAVRPEPYECPFASPRRHGEWKRKENKVVDGRLWGRPL